MKTRFRISIACPILFLSSAFAVSCGSSADREIPGVICGTRIAPDLARPLVKSTENWHEYDRVDRAEAITAPCLVLSGREVVLGFRFSWRDSATDLMYLAKNTGSVSRVTDPHAIDFTYKTIVGTDGAISTTPCRTKGGDYFTLTLQVPSIGLMDHTHRKDIEKFMRAYFPATLKTLGCKGP